MRPVGFGRSFAWLGGDVAWLFETDNLRGRCSGEVSPAPRGIGVGGGEAAWRGTHRGVLKWSGRYGRAGRAAPPSVLEWPRPGTGGRAARGTLCNSAGRGGPPCPGGECGRCCREAGRDARPTCRGVAAAWRGGPGGSRWGRRRLGEPSHQGTQYSDLQRRAGTEACPTGDFACFARDCG